MAQLLGSLKAMDWDMWGYTLWELVKVVQIDELKITSLRAHYGRSIEENSRKFFIVTVQDRTEATMISHIQEWIESGTTIVSDFWRLRKLGKYGYGQWKSAYRHMAERRNIILFWFVLGALTLFTATGINSRLKTEKGVVFYKWMRSQARLFVSVEN